VAEAIDATGRPLGTESFATTLAGYRELLRWPSRHGRVAQVGVEGTGPTGRAWPATSSVKVSWSRGESFGLSASPPTGQVRHRRRRGDGSSCAQRRGCCRAQGRWPSREGAGASSCAPLDDQGPHSGRQPDPRLDRHRQLRSCLRISTPTIASGCAPVFELVTWPITLRPPRPPCEAWRSVTSS